MNRDKEYQSSIPRILGNLHLSSLTGNFKYTVILDSKGVYERQVYFVIYAYTHPQT